MATAFLLLGDSMSICFWGLGRRCSLCLDIVFVPVWNRGFSNDPL